MRHTSEHNINLNLLRNNFEKLKLIAPRPEVCFMIKANAYGHGLDTIMSFSYGELGVISFGLATLGEALYLRNTYPKFETELYVFSDLGLLQKSISEDYLNHRILPVISNIEQLDFLLENNNFKNLPLVLKFNTGMNRLGLSSLDEDLEILVKKFKLNGRKNIYHLMTHFACSNLSMKTNKRNLFQLNEFQKIKKFLKDSNIEIEKTSISNSGAIEQGVGLEETHIRPGLMLYGPSSLLPKYNNLTTWTGENISKLTTSVIQISSIKKGTPIGYGAHPICRDGIYAIIALGYGDGLLNAYRNAKVFCNGHEGQIVGRVNMDMAQVLFDESSMQSIKVGSIIEIFGHDSKKFSDFCIDTKTIPYEVFLGISRRVPKTYINSESVIS